MVKITGKRRITLPAEACRVLGWQPGDRLTVKLVGDEIRLRKDEPAPVLRPLRPEGRKSLMIGAGHGPPDLAENHDKYFAEAVEAESNDDS